MTSQRHTPLLALTAAVAFGLFGGCSSDDTDDSDNNNAGRPTAGAPDSGGSSSNAGAPSNGGRSGQGGDGSALGGAGRDAAGAPAAGAAGDAGAAGGSGGAAALALSDAQILLVLDTLNQGEVEEAYAALPKIQDAAVEAFAKHMVAEHGEGREAVVAVAGELALAPAPSPTQRALREEAEEHVELLRSTPAAEVDATYVQMQIAMHAEALELLTSLHEAADAAELEALIATLKNTVEQHYDTAVGLQETL